MKSFAKMGRRAVTALSVFAALLFSSATGMAATHSAIFVGGPIYSGDHPNVQNVVNDLKSSGFTRVICWSVHIGANGDLIYNGPTFVSNGAYVGPVDWPGYLGQLKKAPTSVTSLAFSIGAWGTPDFTNIAALIKTQGTGPTSILYKNFLALKQAVPSIDTIDFDNEDNYDQNATVQFSLMLGKLGYKVTFCPYTYQSYWINCLSAVNKQSPGLVTAFNLQCYEGGAFNDPADWQNAIAGVGESIPVYPGLELPNVSALQAEDQYASWASEGVSGGFYWIYDGIEGRGQTNDYACAIHAGLLAGRTLNVVNNHSGLALYVPGGSKAQGLQLQQWQQLGDNSQAWTFQYAGSGIFTLVNKGNGLVADDAGGAVNSGAMIDQAASTGAAAQKWRVTLNANGSFRLVNQKSNLYLGVNARSTANAGQIIQSLDNGAVDWSIVPIGMPDPLMRYRVLNQNSRKAVTVANASTSSGALLVQSDDIVSTDRNWSFVPSAGTAYGIVNENSGKPIAPLNASTADNVNVVQVDASDTAEQLWTLVPTGGGWYHIVNKKTGKLLGVANGSTAAGVLIQQKNDDGVTALNWQLLPRTDPPPTMPNAAVVATPASGRVTLRWTAAVGASMYNVKRATSAAGPYSVLTRVSGLQYTDGNVLNGKTYYYTINAVNASGQSADTTPVSATPQVWLAAPAAPGSVSATATVGQISLAWTNPAYATGYRVKRSTSAVGPFTVLSAVASGPFTDRTVIAGKTYYYQVTAYNAYGESPGSVVVSAVAR